uniref:BTB domain-containing protein n=1 Tax=Panagrellus redivivus TaxID=6233 RepID=A0A7E4W8Y9_PANRE
MPVDRYDDLHLRTENSDVTLIVEGTEIPAHRAILSDRSEYFEAMFSSKFMEANLDKVELKETNLKTFQRVLKYIYTGCMDYLYTGDIPLEEMFEVIKSAQYYLVADMVLRTIVYIKTRDSINPRLLLNNALAYSIDELVSHGTKLFLKAMPSIIQNDLFDELSPPAVEHILKFRLNAMESVIFEALIHWMRNNDSYKSTFPQLLEHIELHLLGDEQLVWLLEPTELVDASFIRKLLKEQEEKANQVQKVVNKNVINGVDNLRIVEGEKTAEYISPIAPKNFIIIDLKQQFLLNSLKLKFKLHTNYTVSVSKDLRDWECVVNYLNYENNGPQLHSFKQRAVRFIRFECKASRFVLYADIQARYSVNTFKTFG